MTKIHHGLWWTPVCLMLLMVGCASVSKHQVQGAVCALHGVPLEVGVAPIRYGLPAIDPAYEKRKEKEFANSNSYVLGGCCPGWKQVEVVAYCPKCREADPVAQIKVNGDGALARAREFGAIEIELLIVEYSTAVVEETLREGKLETGELLRLMSQGKGTILGAPRLIAPSGSEADVKSTTEIRFPVAYKEQQGEATTNRIATSRIALTPTDFETREVGVQMSALPEWDEDGQCVHAAMSCEFVYPPDWMTNEITVSTRADTKMKLSYSEPRFHTMSLPATSVRLPLGQTVQVAGGLPAKKKDRVICLFLTAKNATIPEKMEERSNQALEDTGAGAPSPQR